MQKVDPNWKKIRSGKEGVNPNWKKILDLSLWSEVMISDEAFTFSS